MFQGCSKSVSKGVPRKFQENFQGVSKKFHVAWHSSQLPEQKEGLFCKINFSHAFMFSCVSKLDEIIKMDKSMSKMWTKINPIKQKRAEY